MKFVLILACFASFVALSLAQSRTCKGIVPLNEAVCKGKASRGTNRRNNPLCRANANDDMWWYDSQARACKPLKYRGCGGNKNRYCTRIDCQRKCPPRGRN